MQTTARPKRRSTRNGKLTGNPVRKLQFERLALVHLDAIHRAALRLTREAGEAEDLAQEVFLRAYRSFHQFEPGTNCRAWLFKILKNAHVNRERSLVRRSIHLSLSGHGGTLKTSEEDKLAFEGPGPEDLLLNKTMEERISLAVREIPLNFQRTFILCVKGFSYREIAEIEGCPLGTVMSRLYRARRLLQNLLRETAQELSN